MEHVGSEVVLSGWVQRSRDLGGMTYVDLRDRYGITQLAFNLEVDKDVCLKARSIGREFVVKVVGTVAERESKRATEQRNNTAAAEQKHSELIA